MQISELMRTLASVAPLRLAADWDNTGLLLGDAGNSLQKVLVCLTVTPAVVNEAVVEKANIIVAHHPVMFRGVKSLSTLTPEGRLLWPLLKHNIAVYSPHTAYDDAPGGINDGLASRLNLSKVRALRPAPAPGAYKVVVFVPHQNLESVMQAMFQAGAGTIGNYTQCGFRLAGRGTFFGNESANPAIGVPGRREEVEEFRFETIVPAGCLEDVIGALRKAHMYEEPAYDIYPLHPSTLKSRTLEGQGRIGVLPEATPLRLLAQRVKTQLRTETVQVVGNLDRMVSVVGIACGAAGEFLKDAEREGADVFLTGELRFHECLRAESAGMAVLLPGHYATERPGVEDLAVKLQTLCPTLKIWASNQETDPIHSTMN
jgi:dinuclear metal center YbgI/SA1388 family protein